MQGNGDLGIGLSPSFVIELPLEATPRLRLHAQHESDEVRLHDWIENQPALRELVDQARRLAEAA